NGDEKKRFIWKKILEMRFKTGEPYIVFYDAANKNNPPAYQKFNLTVNGSNLCTEIMLATDINHSLVCCLSSLNLAFYDEWKDRAEEVAYYTVWFLDAVMEEFIQKAKQIPALRRAYHFAKKSRALGIGVLGWHTLLQKRSIPFDSFEAMRLNAEIWSKLKAGAEKASKDLYDIYDAPEWAVGLQRRHTHLFAIAPTVSNSTIVGGVSPGIEPIAANVFVQKSAKGVFVRYNSVLKQFLQKYKLDTEDIWKKIIKNDGSVRGLKEIPSDIQDVFLTAREINQFAIIKQAAQRQKFIDQGQSVNLFFVANATPKYIHNVHIEAWKSGLKSLYYLRTTSAGKADLASRSAEECKACEG
ncbi:MAG: hypothetical protein RML94_15650, partial [Bacteroidia bacterium]|nr:hypothetical protein [Bacteroidia bacterium]